MREVRLLPAVIDDVSKGVRWYDEQASKEIGDKFLSVFYSYLPRIGRSSEGYAVIYKDFRRVLLRPFPYSMYYRNHGNWAVVTLVIHSARDPKLWKRLLRDRTVSNLEVGSDF
jgi:hypothetical protein